MAFLKGCQITDGPLLVNEILSWAKKRKKKFFLFKVDFEKAFDTLSWSFLDSIMDQMGFGAKWKTWIQVCLHSAYASVVINGSPTKEFKIEKGLRQGDPLSPFLFILAVEALNVIFLEARSKNIFIGSEIGVDKVPISHLQFADNAIFIGQWSLPNARNLSRILTCFHLASGLKVNFNKSKLFGIGVHSNEVSYVANTIGCLPSQLPCIYLGLQIGANMSRCTNWCPLIENFHKRLSKWKCKTLSYGGRLTLIKSVLGGLGTYYFSSFKVPTTIINKLESIRRNFFWGGNSDERKMAWIAWDKVIAPLDQGGLNIGSLKVFNQAMLSKWWWRFLNEENVFWRKIIISIHGDQGGLSTGSSSPYKLGPWYQIVKLKDDLLSYGITLPSLFKKKIGNGLTTKFWLDSWTGGLPICNMFPRLFHLERNTNYHVNDRAPQPSSRSLFIASVLGGSHRSNAPTSGSQLIHNCPLPMGLSFTWDWIRPLRSAAEQQELQELCSLISNLCLSNDQDMWECTISDDRRFSVKSMQTYINSLLHPLEPPPFRWSKILPIKINISSWRILHKRLPTRCNLDRRGIDLNSTLCPVCDEDIETEEHLFNSCKVVKDTWSKVLVWWKINTVSISSLSDAINLADKVNIRGNLKAFFDVVVQTTLWVLWRFRNETCFSQKRPSKDLILNEIKLSSFNWISCRFRKARLNLISWFDNPCNALCN
ncbi:putative RNA-directed DNA polymerase, eukaryota, reverse transcriptase zinc-binding domain protein [Tanacetum coccineum]|uniref:RNA-directed DNA polymerase, eukaryota, reverse transcriptase zinc-binding domain protein n=1 Tax=Tanacetum coccineum TaxID=301880 RepID=A0ABQ5GSU3_9ASTR